MSQRPTCGARSRGPGGDQAAAEVGKPPARTKARSGANGAAKPRPDGMPEAPRAEATGRLQDLTRLVSDWIWETDRDLVLTYASSRVTELLGFHPAEIIGRPLSELSVDPGELTAVFGAGHPAPPFRALDLRLRSRDGGVHRFKVSGLPVFSGNRQKFVGYRGTAQDVTPLVAKEEALREAVQAAQSANRIKSEFLANTSHELRTPLNAIIGFTEIMHAGRFGPVGSARYRDYLGNVLESAQHLLSLINDILDVAKVEAGRVDLDEALVDPAALADQALRLVSDGAEKAGILLRENLTAPVQIYADARKLRQVLLNLLSNAIKFTPDGGEVELTGALTDRGEFIFRVVDNGIGIAEEGLEAVLTPFGQADSLQRHEAQGTGLGLPLSNALVKLHGGRLEIASVIGEGTEIAVFLPVDRVVHRKLAAGGGQP
ncbi:MAG: PAS domain-containing sensor histidine kinase [Kiloniellales bacterium]|nr:PAS domain-containing sensor histidine kinase [Kiloniellales bacterium]